MKQQSNNYVSIRQNLTMKAAKVALIGVVLLFSTPFILLTIELIVSKK